VDLQRQFVGDAVRRFVPTLNGNETVDGHATRRLTLVPRGQSPYRILKLWVDAESYLVRQFEMEEENGSVRRVEMRNLRINHPLADDLFSFTPPAGTQVFDQ
jgi:outer membrane lipoprotein-sorting protein